MTPEEAMELLAEASGAEEPVTLPPSVLKHVTLANVPKDTLIEIGIPKDGAIHLEWSGTIRNVSGKFLGEADYTWTRKYWYGPLGLEQYLDLVRRAVEVRSKVQGDVELSHYEDDGAYIHLSYTIHTDESELGEAFRRIKAVCDQVEEAAEQASDEIGKRIADAAARLSGWGAESLDELVNAVETARNADERGRSLEELASRILETVSGFLVTGRIRTATEEIDITVLNDSVDPRFRRESALILAECKNWSDKCGKNEFVLFKEKIENRSKRCTLGLLISWNGFKETVTKEMLRGSRDEVLVVPITGKDIRGAVRDRNFPEVLAACWNDAVHL
jgi:hypothetical protein